MTNERDEAPRQADLAFDAEKEYGRFDLAEVCSLALRNFDFRKYLGAAKFSIVEWSSAFEERAHYFFYPKSMEEWKKGFRVMYALKLMDEPLRVRAKPESVRDPVVTDMDLASAWCARDTIGRMPDEKRICELWAADMNTLDETPVDWESDEGISAFLDRKDAKQREFDAVFDSYNEALDRAGIYAGGRFVQVDTSAPDALVLQHFKEWLSAFRSAERGGSPRGISITETDMRKWAHNRVLAYLDIILLSRWSGVRLSAHKIGSMIFPDISDVDVAEKVRKTTAPLALSLVEGEMPEAIRLMAANAGMQDGRN